MHGTYNPYLVLLSLMIAVLSLYTAFDLAAKIRFIQDVGTRRRSWLLGGAGAVGLGIWAMHFIGMLALKVPTEISYDPWIICFSLVIAVATAYFALSVMTQYRLTLRWMGFGGLLTGLGIVGMHYAGMAAIRMRPSMHYRPLMVLASIGVALGFSWGLFWITCALNNEKQRHVVFKRCLASLVLGQVIAGIHDVCVSAAIFPQGAVYETVRGISTNSVFLIVSVLSLCGLIMTLILSTLDSRFDRLLFHSNLSLENANKRLQMLATVDALTGIPNRNLFLERMEDRILAAHRDGKPFSILFLNLDEFKGINDFLGHAAGDELLKAFAQELSNRVRSVDLVARLGSDEFVVLLEGIGLEPDVAPVAAAVLERMRKDFVISGMPLRVTASMGIASYPRDGGTVSSLLKNADMAMYDAKQHGRNTYRFFHPNMIDTSTRVMQIQRDLANALEKGEFTLAFQAKFSGLHNRLTGAEALIRWNHPKLGVLSPMEFIPIAEQTGQIAQISEWVIAEVCRQMNGWERAGLPLLRIAINLSPEQLRQERYVEIVSSIVHDFGIESYQIMFEVTESVAMRDPAMAGEIIRQFQRSGFDISLDDFGIGYSSLAYLRQFRVKELKIDRSFINGLDADGDGEESRAIVSAIIALAHSLHMTVVAEGVETVTQLEKLQELGCDELQGYLLAMPLEIEEFRQFLKEQTERDASLWVRMKLDDSPQTLIR